MQGAAKRLAKTRGDPCKGLHIGMRCHAPVADLLASLLHAQKALPTCACVPDSS